MKILLLLIKKILGNSSWVRIKSSQVYHYPTKFYKRPHVTNINKILNNYFKSEHPKYFIQIGSNDGITSDPLFPFIEMNLLEGIKIEPVSYIFKILQRNFQKYPKILCLNFAIGTQTAILDFYRLKEKDNHGEPILHTQQGSFNKEQLYSLKDIYPNLKELIICEKVQCYTFSDFIQNYNIKKIEILHIDAEGYDWEILKQINYKLITPEIIIYENSSLSSSDYFESVKKLKEEGYQVRECFGDTIATKIIKQ